MTHREPPPGGSGPSGPDDRNRRTDRPRGEEGGIPDLPSDEELGIEDLDEEALLREFGPGAEEEDALDALDPSLLPSEPSRPEGGAGAGAGTRGARGDAGAAAGGAASASSRNRPGPTGTPAGKPRGAAPPPPGGSGKAPPPPEPPRRRGGTAPRPPREGGAGGAGAWIVALAAALVLAGGSWLASGNQARPAPVPANAPDTAFSSARAMTHLVELARAPRPVGAPEHDRARELVFGWLQELGLEPELHETVSLRRAGSGDLLRGASLRSVVARLPASLPPGVPRRSVVLTAHYDAVPLSHGAGDDGVGVVAIVEAVRALQASLAAGAPPLANDLVILLTDGEEIGLLGARAFVESHPWMEEVRLVVSAEMRGTGGPVHMFETGPDNGWILGALGAADPYPWGTSVAVEVYRRLPNDTDFTPFREAGVQGLNLAGIGGARHYHQATDRPANVDEATLQHMGARLLALAAGLGRADLEEVHAPDRVFLTLPQVGMVGYTRGLALPISAGVVLLWILAGWVAVRRSRRPEGGTGASRGAPTDADAASGAAGAGGRAPRGGWAFLVGAIVGLLAVGLGALAGWGLLQLLPRFHPEFGLFTPAVDGEGRYVVALGLLAGGLLLTMAALAGFGRRGLPLVPLLAGSLWPLAAGTLGAGIFVPLGAMEFQLGLAGASLAVLVLALTGVPGAGDGQRMSAAGLAGGLLATLLVLPGLGALLPLVEGVPEALSLRLAPVVGGLAGLLALAILPGLVALLAPNRWWAPTALLGGAGGLLAWGLLGAGPSPERHLPSTLLWTLDRSSASGTQEAGMEEAGMEVAETGGEDLPTARWLTRDDPGFEWVRERVGPFDEAEARPEFLLPGSGWRAATAPVVSLPRPRVEVEEVEEVGPAPSLPGAGARDAVGPSRRVLVRVGSGVGAEILSVVLPERSALRSVDGVRPPEGPAGAPGARRDLSRFVHQGRPFHPDGLLLEVEVPGGTELLEMVVVEEHLRAPELLAGRLAGSPEPAASRPGGGGPFVRPPGLIPSTAGRSDRALIRTPFALPLDPAPPQEAGALPDPAPEEGVDPAPAPPTLPEPGASGSPASSPP
jgi:hypothetical protein